MLVVWAIYLDVFSYCLLISVELQLQKSVDTLQL